MPNANGDAKDNMLNKVFEWPDIGINEFPILYKVMNWIFTKESFVLPGKCLFHYVEIYKKYVKPSELFQISIFAQITASSLQGLSSADVLCGMFLVFALVAF